MFKFLLILALPFSLLAQTLGSAHGYMVLDNGQIYTSRSYFPSADMVDMFKPNGVFILPHLVESTGTNYVITNDNVLYTADADGYFYKKIDYLYDKSISKIGGSFFITRDDSAHIVMSNGVVVEHKDSDEDYFRKAKIAGGVYLITRSDELVVLNPLNGGYAKYAGKFEEEAKDVKTIGHNYFIMEDGTLYTIGLSKDGFSVNKIPRSGLFRNLKRVGGNYFFDFKNNVHTVSLDGTLDGGIKNRQIKVTAPGLNKDKSKAIPEHIGGNYFVYDDGEVWVVDSQGIFYYLKTLPFYERIGRTNLIQEE